MTADLTSSPARLTHRRADRTGGRAPARRVAVTVAAIAAGAVVVWLDWHPGSANPAVPTNRVALIITVGLLAALPWLADLLLGPVADSRTARTVRAGGYLSVYALLLVLVGLSRFAGSRFDDFHAFDQANWEADMRSGAMVSAVLLVAVIGGYAGTLLILTARRTHLPPKALMTATALAAAIAVAMYALMPLGNPAHPNNSLLGAGYRLLLVSVPLVALLAVGPWTARTTATAAGRLRVGVFSGLYTGAAAALLLAVLTITTMLLFPHHVTLEWANPSPAVAHGTTYELQMSVGDAAIKYLAGLLLGPLLGLILAALATGLSGPTSRSPAANPLG
jgi:hypothetical protein